MLLVVVLFEAKLLITFILVTEHQLYIVLLVLLTLLRLHYSGVILHFILPRFKLCMMQAQHGYQGRQIPNQVEDVLQEYFLKLVFHDLTKHLGHKQNVENNPYDVASDEQAEEHVELVLCAADYHIAQGNLLEHQCEPEK